MAAKMRTCVLILINVTFIYPFLLDTSNTKPGAQGGTQYLTLSQFIDERDHQNRQFQQEFNLLASQLNTKFAELELKLSSNNKGNDTCKNFDSDIKLIQELSTNYTDLQHSFKHLQERFITQNKEMERLQNKSNEQESEINLLKGLKTIQPLIDVKDLKEEVQSLTVKYQELAMNQQARNEDLQSLYQELVQSKQFIRGFQDTIQHIESNQTALVERMEHTLNSSLLELTKQMQQSHKAVALLAKGVTGSTGRNDIIHFRNVRHFYGISHSTISQFQSTGMFVCEIEGMYFISSNIISSARGSWFTIRTDNEELSRTYIADHVDSFYHSATGIALVDLKRGNKVYIQVGSSLTSSPTENTFVIFKV